MDVYTHVRVCAHTHKTLPIYAKYVCIYGNLLIIQEQIKYWIQIFNISLHLRMQLSH